MEEVIIINGQETNREELEDLAERYSLKDIALEFGLKSPYYMSQILDKHKIPRLKRKTLEELEKEHGSEIVKLYQEGYAVGTIKTVLRMDPHTVTNILAKRGIKVEKRPPKKKCFSPSQRAEKVRL